MNRLIDLSKLTVRVGTYQTGNTEALLDTSLLQRTRMRRRQLGRDQRIGLIVVLTTL